MSLELDIYRAILLAFVVACFGLLLYRQIAMPAHAAAAPGERLTDRLVLLVIAAGLIAILLSIVWGLFISAHSPGTKDIPNWAENVLVAISTASALKLGDCLAALVALAGGRQVQRLGEKLGDSQPMDKGPGGDGAPSGTEEDPFHVAGAATGERPVKTTPERPKK